MSASLDVVAHGPAAEAVGRLVPQLVTEGFAGGLFARDATLWGPDAELEAVKRLAWVDLARSSRPLVGQIAAMRDELVGAGIDRVVLCGMGGSSLAPEVICAAEERDLTVLDSSEPEQVRAALSHRLASTVVVVSSKSGSTVETDSQRRAFVAAFEEAGIDPADRIVVVTDPGSPLEESARAAGHRVVTADPEVGGRFSALTAFGLVPSGLAGADVERLLDEAEIVSDLLAEDDDANPGLRLGAAIAGTDPLRDKLVLLDSGSGLPGFAAWAEQLIAESTGKHGTGLVPVVVDDVDSPEVTAGWDDVTVATLVGDNDQEDRATETSRVTVSGSLGAQLLLWEVATAVAGRLLGINPFDQPDVESAKQAARGFLDAPPEEGEALLSEGPLAAYAPGDSTWLGDPESVEAAVAVLLEQLDAERGYLAVMAYLDRGAHADLASVRDHLAARAMRPVTFGWGPRFLHSTGQLHKGGPQVGVFLQITATASRDLAIPGRDFGFATLLAAQAAGDAAVLAAKARPVLRLHLDDVDAGVEALHALLEQPGR